MQYLTASDGVRLGYVVDDFTDPWKPPETPRAPARGHGQLEADCMPGCRGWPATSGWCASTCAATAAPRFRTTPLPFTLDRLARDVIDLLDHLGVDRVHLAGSSAGAIISMKVAI